VQASGLPAASHRSIPKSHDSNVEAIQPLIVARRSARDMCISSINQIRHLSFTAPNELWERLRPLTATMLPRSAAALRPRVGLPRLCELRHPFEEDDARCGLDEREVGEGLGEVAEVVTGVGVELFCVEAEGGGDA
jgi:hypothetical protein